MVTIFDTTTRKENEIYWYTKGEASLVLGDRQVSGYIGYQISRDGRRPLLECTREETLDSTISENIPLHEEMTKYSHLKRLVTYGIKQSKRN